MVRVDVRGPTALGQAAKVLSVQQRKYAAHQQLVVWARGTGAGGWVQVLALLQYSCRLVIHSLGMPDPLFTTFDEHALLDVLPRMRHLHIPSFPNNPKPSSRMDRAPFARSKYKLPTGCLQGECPMSLVAQTQ